MKNINQDNTLCNFVHLRFGADVHLRFVLLQLCSPEIWSSIATPYIVPRCCNLYFSPEVRCIIAPEIRISVASPYVGL